MKRLRRNTEDAGLLLGTAEELIESVGKFVLEENGRLPDRRTDFHEVMVLSMELLGIMPVQVDASTEGGKQLHRLYQAVCTVVDAGNELRNDHGTGHGQAARRRVRGSGAADDQAGHEGRRDDAGGP